jgi:hypothetical protein
MDKLVIHMPLIHGIQFYVSHSWNPNETLTRGGILNICLEGHDKTI